MGYKRWVCFGVNTFFAIALIVIGIITEPIIEKAIQSQVNDKAVMTEDNYNTWAYIPGHTDVKIQRGFTFFNLLNPDDVKWNGARPLLNVTREYPYYEFD